MNIRKVKIRNLHACESGSYSLNELNCIGNPSSAKPGVVGTCFGLALSMLVVSTAAAQSSDCILWSADHEEGDMSDWEYPDFQYSGGGIFNTDEDNVEYGASRDVARTGNFSAKTTIKNAFQSQNGKKAVRLMRWTDRPWDDGGELFPNPAYFSTWMYFPEKYNPKKSPPWDPGDGGWWNIFQFKSNDANGVSQPLWTMNVFQNETTGNNSVYLYTKYNSPASRFQDRPVTLPVGRWVHLEALYVASETNGRITIWQDGVEIIDAQNVVTLPDAGEGNVVFGIGNYTDHIAGGAVDGTATVYFDDTIVSTERIYGNQNCGSEEPNPKLSLQQVEVDEDAGVAVIPVTLEPAATATVNVSFRTGPLTANPGEDFYGVFEVLNFAAGETRKDVPVAIINDSVSESQESFSTFLWDAGDIEISNGQETVLINDDDEDGNEPPQRLSIEDIEIQEGQSGQVEIELLNANGSGASVSIATSAGSAVNGNDFYGLYQESLPFAAGESSKIVNVFTIDDDISESDEFLTIRLFSESGAEIARGEAQIRIIDND